MLPLPRFRAGVAALGVAALLGCGGALTAPAPAPSTPRIDALLDTISRRTFDFFWERTDARTGLTPDRWPTRSFSSIAAVGFALTAYPIGAEGGYITRDAAAERVLNTLRFFYQLPQGPAPPARPRPPRRPSADRRFRCATSPIRRCLGSIAPRAPC